MKTVSRELLTPEQWDGLVDASDEAWLYHRSVWIDLERRFFVRKDLSFAVIDGAEVVGVHPLYLAGPENGLGWEQIVHSGFHRLAGLALRDGLERDRVNAGRECAMRRVFELSEAYDVDRIQLGAQSAAPDYRRAKVQIVPYLVKDFGFQSGVAFGKNGVKPCPGMSSVAADQQVQLDDEEAVLFQRLEESCRRAVRKSLKSGLEWSIGPVSGRLEAYFALAQRSSARTGEVLPSIEYYRAIGEVLDGTGRSLVAISSRENIPVAALLLLRDKGVLSFLAGVSDPDALEHRCNDHVHWEAIRWARDEGLDVYRLGPIFPEVPKEWPIARVSAFKGKFGGRSVPMLYANKYRHPEKYLTHLADRASDDMDVGRLSIVERPSPSSVAIDVIEHHLGIFGLSKCAASGPLVLERPTIQDAGRARRALASGCPIVAILPHADFAATFDVAYEVADITLEAGGAETLHGAMANGQRWGRLRTLHRSRRFRALAGAQLTPIVTDRDGRLCWTWSQVGASGILYVGSNLASDLVRYRQGDPAAVEKRPSEAMWGIAGERPNYLFEAQLAGEATSERHADWWMEALTHTLTTLGGVPRRPMLPGGAAGAIVVTGDDDQAPLADYASQEELLAGLPITYFLHPLTKLDRSTLSNMSGTRRVEFGIHPDALESPNRYAEVFAEQVAWFTALTGSAPQTVRNHGFLNDGYWRHARAWRQHGVVGSSNLPGLDGRVLNGSLLPARLALDGELTNHWSMLTAVGDGVVFIHGWNDVQSGNCLLNMAQDIRDSGVPGVIVVNLHPANVAKTVGMHQALRKIEASGFITWTFSECIEWFAGRNARQDSAGARDAASVGTEKIAMSPRVTGERGGGLSSLVRRFWP